MVRGQTKCWAGITLRFLCLWPACYINGVFFSLAKEAFFIQQNHQIDWAESLFQAARYAKVFGDKSKFTEDVFQYFERRKLTRPTVPLRPKLRWLTLDFIKKQPRAPESYAPPFRGDVFVNYLYLSLVNPGMQAILRVADRNSMAHSVESRVPFLDHRIAELAFRCPDSLKILNGSTKRLLRESTKGILPNKVRQRQGKVGFSVPQDQWFKRELGDYLQGLFGAGSLLSEPYLDPAGVASLLEHHRGGQGNYSPELWRAINLEVWLKNIGTHTTASAA